MNLSFLSQFGFAKANEKGIYEIPFLDRMGFVFAICIAGMVFISFNKGGSVSAVVTRL